ELPLAAPWFEQPVGIPVPPLRGEHRARRNTRTTGWVELEYQKLPKPRVTGRHRGRKETRSKAVGGRTCEIVARFSRSEGQFCWSAGSWLRRSPFPGPSPRSRGRPPSLRRGRACRRGISFAAWGRGGAYSAAALGGGWARGPP